MLLIMITHADARFVEAGRYRGLTEIGREQVRAAAAEFRKTLPPIMRTSNGKIKAIGKIMSSPMARCVETVMLFADEIRDLTNTSEICIEPKLKEKPREKDKPIECLKSEDLVAALKSVKEDVILVGAHADLGGALPPSKRLIDGVIDDKGFFNSRPVLLVVDYQPDKWENASVLYCQAYKDSPMKNWLAQ